MSVASSTPVKAPAPLFGRLLPEYASSVFSVSYDFFSPCLCNSDSPFPCCLTCSQAQYSLSTSQGWPDATCHLVCPWLVKSSGMGTSQRTALVNTFQVQFAPRRNFLYAVASPGRLLISRWGIGLGGRLSDGTAEPR